MLAPTLQTRWDWRAAGNFICGGTGTGLMIFASVMALFDYVTTWYGLAAALFIACGLAMVWLEIGRPLRSANVFLNPRTSWMTRESYLSLAVVPLGLLATLVDSITVLIIAAIPALGFLYAQARILYAAKGIPAWRSKEVIGVILSTGLTEGAGIFLIGSALFGNGAWHSQPLAAWISVMALIVLRAKAWVMYRSRLSRYAPIEAVDKLASIDLPLFFIGLLTPFGLAFYAIFNPSYQLPLAIITGLCITLSGWLCKYTIILRAAYTQGYAISHTPARGGGQPGPGLQPGWRTPS